ncbi:hypothetical protein MJH12_12170, partial [bacterium]|nr:hypothetical protein [bacterium]
SQLLIITFFCLLQRPFANVQQCIATLKLTYPMKDLKKARVLSYKCTTKHKKNAELFYLRGLLDTQAKKYHRANKSFKIALKIDEEVEANYHSLLQSYLLSQQSSKNYKWLIKKFVLRFHNNPGALLKFGDLFFVHAQNKTAFFYFKLLIEKKCKSPWKYFLKLGELQLISKSYDQALKFLEESLRLNPKSAFTLFCLGKTWLAKGHLQFAISYYQHAKDLGISKNLVKIIDADLKQLLQESKKN